MPKRSPIYGQIKSNFSSKILLKRSMPYLPHPPTPRPPSGYAPDLVLYRAISLGRLGNKFNICCWYFSVVFFLIYWCKMHFVINVIFCNKIVAFLITLAIGNKTVPFYNKKADPFCNKLLSHFQ